MTATVWGRAGNEYCTTTGGAAPTYARRCFEITPTITNTAAQVRLWLLDTELNGLTPASLYVYRNVGGGAWNQLLPNRATGNDGDTYTWVEGDTPGFRFSSWAAPARQPRCG